MRLALGIILAVSILASASDNLDDLSFDDEEEINNTSNSEGSRPPKLPSTDEEKRDMLKKVMTAAMQRPGARKRLGQVLPIIRQMSAPQRLALASLVISQVLADPKDPVPEMPKTPENTTAQLMLPISMDIASIFRGLGREQATGRSSNMVTELYQSGRMGPAAAPNIRRAVQPSSGINRRNANVHIDKLPSKPRSGRPLRKPIGAKIQTCSKVLNNLCLETNDYPEESIIRTILTDQNPERFQTFMSEPPIDGELEPELRRRKSDGVDSGKGHMCSSRVELARPKKARATSGQWKFIVNTKDYTQTLRLEICSRPQSRCHYLPDGVDSQCVQVYNYHRLLTWDEVSGLTMDVFKVPTCCSCQVIGFNGQPFGSLENAQLPPQDVDSNLVSSDDKPSIRVPHVQPNTKPMRGYIPPKRESVRRPVVQHRGPPLPLEGEVPPQDIRYPPLDNTLRRTTRNNTTERIKFKPTLNSRHPALPIDSMNADTMSIPSIPPGPRPSSPPSRRINYSYHPIIDYFRPQQEEVKAESRIGHDWTPITGGDVVR